MHPIRMFMGVETCFPTVRPLTQSVFSSPPASCDTRGGLFQQTSLRKAFHPKVAVPAGAIHVPWQPPLCSLLHRHRPDPCSPVPDDQLLGGGQPDLWSQVRFHRFDNDALEASFQRKHAQSTRQSCHLWAATQVLYVAVFPFASITLVSLIKDVTFWALFSIPLLLAAVLTVFSLSGVVTGSRLHNLFAICYCLSLAIHCSQFYVFMVYFRERNWELPADNTVAIALFDKLVSIIFVLFFHVDQQLQLLPLLRVGFCPATLVAIVVGPVMNVVLTTVALPHQLTSYLMCYITLLTAGVVFVYCRSGSILRRSLFLMEVQKVRRSEQMQRTDATVNHILKNAMVEASGLIEVFLELCVPPPPPDLVAAYLQVALQRLHGGMMWCRRRGALLELMGDEAKPTLKPTSLTTLGTALVGARAITSSFAPVTVELDEVLTDLMLENALSNAFRHGHPTDPNVCFSITVELDPSAPTAGACVVTFRITNRSDPNRQPLREGMGTALVQTGASSALVPVAEAVWGRRGTADGGLEYCFRAAQLQGIAVSLSQEGNLVTFQAFLATRLTSAEPDPTTPSPRCLPSEALPLGLRISVMDDSASARILLRHQLSRDLPGCVVETFGTSSEDVDPFLSHTLLAADIAILDQHLDWPSGSNFQGTDLVRLLLQAGFRGLLCIRSANVSEMDVPQYFAAGAHCVLDKLLDRAQMVATLASQYRQFVAIHRWPSEPSPRSTEGPLAGEPSEQFGAVTFPESL
eukprot:GGOE01043396.1.p1 GENE.GGOE01043396.1~~GGOE01043396.1.p1  ORF type:complete len:748 (+),score=147.06 GGOE01043396.1:116-2359(+)